ncbi:MAG: hypothetical protein JO306_07700 [Gemmatimonadetes bacterium]|nr:hypothetical protein [Gemmatimonadota bacterium]
MDLADNRTGIFHTINGETREICVELPDVRQMEIWSRWTPGERFRAAAELARGADDFLRAQLRSLHPEWSDDEIRREIRRRRLGKRL